ncbi:MAG TPA: fibronectin type III domain-containing protein [Oligoflexia bacterium]|nr:fibronectin type III domain-containing protein [Oligoflexia bacterium]HMP48819.1 fibronectin type III domain-containing protein [Oligoflexia bacterium]
MLSKLNFSHYSYDLSQSRLVKNSLVKIFYFFIAGILLFLPSSVFASIDLQWDPPTVYTDGKPLTDISHFVVNISKDNSSDFTYSTNVDGTSFHINDLGSGAYKATVSAVDYQGKQGEFSEEIIFVVIEGELDSDADGVSDKKELEDGTNPFDRGSHLPLHETNICAPWNGFLMDDRGQGMWNVYEHLNTSSNPLSVATQILDPQGELNQQYYFSIQGGTQRDILIHDFEARKAESYGNVCSQSNGKIGDLRGTMVYYKPSGSNKSSAFDFALAIPATSPRSGPQFIPLNTHNPSLAPEDKNNTLSSWVQITNYNSSMESGVLKYYRSDGVLVRQTPVSLAENSRVDFPLHDVGPDTVGFVEWSPSSRTARFKIDSTRYYYDNPWAINSFEGAAFLPGFVPTGAVIGAPYDTRNSSAILELSNVANQEENVSVRAFSPSGQMLYNTEIALAPKTTFHLIMDQIMPNQRGLVTAQSVSGNSIFGNMMQYKRKNNGGIFYLYSTPAVPALGSDLSSSYNTFMNHQSEILILNFSSETVLALLGVTRLSGEKIIDSEPISLAPNSTRVVKVNEREGPDNYGVVRVLTSSNNSVGAWVLRERAGEYNMPLQLSQ